MSHGSLFSPHTRGEIVRSVNRSQNHAWQGSRQGTKATIRLSDQANPNGERVYFGATYQAHQTSGTAKTIGDALDRIEKFVEEKRS